MLSKNVQEVLLKLQHRLKTDMIGPYFWYAVPILLTEFTNSKMSRQSKVHTIIRTGANKCEICIT